MFTKDCGGMAGGSAKMLEKTCDLVIAVRSSAAELREVCFGWEGLAQGFSAGGILIDLGNTDPVETVNIANELAAAGGDLVAAPAFGTPAQAKEGRLTVLVGGPGAPSARCRLAVATDTRSPLIDATLAAWSAAERKLGYGADHSSVIKWLETLPSLKPVPEQEPKPEPVGSTPTV